MRRRQQQIKGSDLIYELPLTLQEVCTGTNKTISLQHGGRMEQISVKIPKGMTDGKKLRLAGKGEQGPFGGTPGDLFIKAKLVKDSVFELDGSDLYVNKTITLSEALLGTEISVRTAEDKDITLKIPQGTQHKTKMRLSGMGIPKMNSTDNGDLYVRINVKIPKRLTEEQKKAIEKMKEAGL